MIQPRDRMYLKLMALPILFFFSAVFVEILLESFIKNAKGPLLYLADPINIAIPYLMFILLVAGLGFAVHSIYTWWVWQSGKGECCHVCGGIVRLRDGRYGLFWHCLACGKNRNSGR